MMRNVMEEFVKKANAKVSAEPTMNVQKMKNVYQICVKSYASLQINANINNPAFREFVYLDAEVILIVKVKRLVSTTNAQILAQNQESVDQTLNANLMDILQDANAQLDLKPLYQPNMGAFVYLLHAKIILTVAKDMFVPQMELAWPRVLAITNALKENAAPMDSA